MSNSGDHRPRNWREQIKDIAAGWLFSDCPSLPSTVILPLENPDLHDPSTLEKHLIDRVQARAVTVGTYCGQRIGVLTSKFGSPAVAMVAETLAQFGVHNVVGLGFCGGLSPSVASGDLLIPVGAVRNEGTTPHYAPPIFPALPDRGIVWTTDAILMETSEAVREWSDLGVMGVDMECAALFVVSHLSGIKAAAVLVVSDHPERGELANSERVRVAHDAGALAVLDVAAALSA